MRSIEHHISKDGSSTFYSKDFDQFYHNPNGAISESRHVFFEQSGFLNYLTSVSNPISIFEMGFGTGLNFLLLMEYINKQKVKVPVHFFSVEAFPANLELVNNINYLDALDVEFSKDQFQRIFTDLKSGWNNFIFPSYPLLQLSLFVGYFDEMPAPISKFDFFFHDPFSPEVNSELWTVEIFQKLAGFASNEAVLSTYCAASKARAALAKAGWLVAKSSGALGKREMTIASLNEKKLIRLKRVNELRLIKRYDNGDFAD